MLSGFSFIFLPNSFPLSFTSRLLSVLSLNFSLSPSLSCLPSLLFPLPSPLAPLLYSFTLSLIRLFSVVTQVPPSPDLMSFPLLFLFFLPLHSIFLFPYSPFLFLSSPVFSHLHSLLFSPPLFSSLLLSPSLFAPISSLILFCSRKYCHLLNRIRNNQKF